MAHKTLTMMATESVGSLLVAFDKYRRRLGGNQRDNDFIFRWQSAIQRRIVDLMDARFPLAHAIPTVPALPKKLCNQLPRRKQRQQRSTNIPTTGSATIDNGIDEAGGNNEPSGIDEAGANNEPSGINNEHDNDDSNGAVGVDGTSATKTHKSKLPKISPPVSADAHAFHIQHGSIPQCTGIVKRPRS